MADGALNPIQSPKLQPKTLAMMPSILREQPWGSRWSRLLAPFQRITTSGRFIPEVDGFRFIAILLVFVFHLAGTVATNSPSELIPSIENGSLRQIANTLDIGVPLFFTISGFILGLPFAEAALKQKKQVNLKKYFLRRLTRLEPPYILCLMISVLIKVVSGRGIVRYLPHLLASMFYVHNAYFGYQSTIDSVAWSLEVEVQFYILAPLLAAVFLIRTGYARKFLLGAMIVASTAVSVLVKADLRLWLSLLGFAPFFLIGFLLADGFITWPKSTTWRWDLVFAVGLPALIVLRWETPQVSAWLAPWLIWAVFQAGLNGVVFRRFLSWPIITTIGGMCYSIYLFHNQLIYGFALVTRHVFFASPYGLRLICQFLLIAPLVLVVTGAYFVFVERPCMRPDWFPSALQWFRQWLTALRGREAVTGETQL
jgi:peptidoglycan/LPS O-acetylase OafA/YrhL